MPTQRSIASDSSESLGTSASGELVDDSVTVGSSAGSTSVVGTERSAFEGFVQEVGPRLRLALISAYGPETGSEATAEALAYAWEHWSRLSQMDNPAGYLYRVGQSRSRRLFRRRPALPFPLANPAPMVEPALPRALASLSRQQRAAVLLVHGYGWSVRESAEVLGVAPSTVQRNADRALTALRRELGVNDVA